MRLDTVEYAYSVEFMCIRLGVSKSGYYNWRGRPESMTAQRREELKLLIQKAFEDSDSTYGHRRIQAQLHRWGIAAGLELVRRLMRELGLEPCQPKPKRFGLTRHTPGPVPDLVGRNFTAETPGEKLVGSGSRRESHPPAPTEPCVTVSRYTALATLFTRNYGTGANARTFPGIAL
ncbi:IS3 family transposase [Streptomyces sp. NPDC002547]